MKFTEGEGLVNVQFIIFTLLTIGPNKKLPVARFELVAVKVKFPEERIFVCGLVQIPFIKVTLLGNKGKSTEQAQFASGAQEIKGIEIMLAKFRKVLPV
jgi:hypothetical protein